MERILTNQSDVRYLVHQACFSLAMFLLQGHSLELVGNGLMCLWEGSCGLGLGLELHLHQNKHLEWEADLMGWSLGPPLPLPT